MTDAQWKKHQENEATEVDRIALQQQFDTLPPEAQHLYNDVLEYGHQSMVLKNQLMAEKANDYIRLLEESAKDATELKELKDSLKSTVRLAQSQIHNFTQPYVPLLRRGSHVVVARLDKQNRGNVYLKTRIVTAHRLFNLVNCCLCAHS